MSLNPACSSARRPRAPLPSSAAHTRRPAASSRSATAAKVAVPYGKYRELGRQSAEAEALCAEQQEAVDDEEDGGGGGGGEHLAQRVLEQEPEQAGRDRPHHEQPAEAGVVVQRALLDAILHLPTGTLARMGKKRAARVDGRVLDLAIAIGISEPKVAILAAVEPVTDQLPSTLDAAALCKMAERGTSIKL